MGERGNRSTDRWAFTRADRIGLTALLFVVNGFSLFGWVVAPILSWLRGDPVWTPFISRVTVPELDGAGVTYSVATYDIRVVGPTTGQRLFGLAVGVLWAALLVAGSLIVARLMRSIAEERLRPGQRRPAALAGCTPAGSRAGRLRRRSLRARSVGDRCRVGWAPSHGQHLHPVAADRGRAGRRPHRPGIRGRGGAA